MPVQAERRIPVSRPENSQRLSAIDAALLAGTFLTLASIVGIVAYNVPREPVKTAPSESPKPTPAPQRVFYNSQNAPEILIAALTEPGSRLLSEIQDAFNRDGDEIKGFSNCPSEGRANRVFSNPAVKRIAPSKNSPAVREIEAGEPFKAAIEAVVNNFRRQDVTEVWMAEITPGGIYWAIEEQKYRDSVLKEFAISTGKKCTPFELPFELYKVGPRGPIQKIK